MGIPLSALFSFALGLIYGSRNRSISRTLLFIVAWIGAIEAVYGIVAVLTDPSTVLWQQRPQYVGDVTGTFINRNTAAAYFGCVTLIWAIILAEKVRYRTLSPARLAPRTFDAGDFRSSAELIVPALFCTVSIIALLGTASRAGIIFSFLTLSVVLVLYLKRHIRGRRARAVFAVAVLVFTLLFIQLLGGDVNTRFTSEGFIDRARWQTYMSTFSIIGEHFWIGTGLGTFSLAFPLYRNSAQSMFGVWDMAHSTPLQLASEMGVPFASIVLTGWTLFAVLIGRAATVRRHDLFVVSTTVGVVLIGSLTSLIDFSMQVPGFCIVVCGIFGCGVAECLRIPVEKLAKARLQNSKRCSELLPRV